MQNDAAECIDSGTFLTRRIPFRSRRARAELRHATASTKARPLARIHERQRARPGSRRLPFGHRPLRRNAPPQGRMLRPSETLRPGRATRRDVGKPVSLVSLHRVRHRGLRQPRDRLEREARLCDSDWTSPSRDDALNVRADDVTFGDHQQWMPGLYRLRAPRLPRTRGSMNSAHFHRVSEAEQ